MEAFGRLADEVGCLEACLGFEPINEPHRGLVNLHAFHNFNYTTDLHIGHCPSLAESLALGSGYAQTVNYYVKSWPFPTRISHRSLIDPKGRSAWLPLTGEMVDRPQGLGRCVWRAHGLWDWDEEKQTTIVLQHDYFDHDHRFGQEGRRIEWYRDFYAPFLRRFSDRVSRKNSHYLTFIEPIPNECIPPWPPAHQVDSIEALNDTNQPDRLVYAPHFYDLNVLFNKSYTWMSVNVQGLSRGKFILKALYFGARGLRKNYREQISTIIKQSHSSLGVGVVPVFIGEVGLPFDLNMGTAFKTGCYDKQRELMNSLIGAMEDNLVGFTLWNYNPYNKVEYGDGWNKEDFSVINSDRIVDGGPIRPDYRNRVHENDEIYRGGRTLDVVIRPYAVKVAGYPIWSHWDCNTLRYQFEWNSIGSDEQEEVTDKSCLTEIYVPGYHYAEERMCVKLSDGCYRFDEVQQTLYVWHQAHANGEVRHSLSF